MPWSLWRGGLPDRPADGLAPRATRGRHFAPEGIPPPVGRTGLAYVAIALSAHRVHRRSGGLSIQNHAFYIISDDYQSIMSEGRPAIASRCSSAAGPDIAQLCFCARRSQVQAPTACGVGRRGRCQRVLYSAPGQRSATLMVSIYGRHTGELRDLETERQGHGTPVRRRGCPQPPAGRHAGRRAKRRRSP